jgi:hypothetical protein
MRIDDLFGARFADGGRGPDEYDCFGLFEELCRRRGETVAPESNPVGERAKAAAIAAAIERGEWVRLAAPEPGCAVAFRIIPPFVSHIGMVLDCGSRFIHIRQGPNVTVERLDSLRWKHLIAGFYRHA